MSVIAARGGSGVTPAASLSGYKAGTAGNYSTSSQAGEEKEPYKPLEKLKKGYLDYIYSKKEEIEEQQDARRFRHGSQWTSEQIKQLNLRRQPIVTSSILARKINGIVGTIARLKQDPKAYPRTPKQEQGADLSTAVLKYVMDSQSFDAIDTFCCECGAVDGIGGLELNLIQGDQGDPEIGLEPVQPDGFFYDPRSYKNDFSDCRYMGVGKWLDVEQAKEMFPDKADEIEASYDSGTELSSNPDREFRWFITDGENRQIRIVDHWYIRNGKWYWAIYTGAFKLMEGESFLKDEKGNGSCKYIMYSAYVDQDGDRYGFVRNLKPLVTEINMRRSKALYTMLSRRILSQKGAFENVELARREAARADGIVEYNPGFEVNFDDQARQAETQAQFQFLGDVKEEVESFGPNIAIAGQGLEQSSGRAINLLQNAGLADLGPFIKAYRSWKIRVYRAIWNAVMRNWKAERWIRVTDDEDLVQFIQVNGLQVDPMTGMPTLVNALGNLDVDIIMDEGPDSVSMQMDAYDTLSVMARAGTNIPPDVLIELAPLPAAVKKRLMDKLNPQILQQRMQTQMAGEQEKVKEISASAELKHAQAQAALMKAHAALQPKPQAAGSPPEHPMKVQADIAKMVADATHKHAQARKTNIEADLLPHELALEGQKLQNEQRRHLDQMVQHAQDQSQQHFQFTHPSKRPKGE